MQNNIIDACKKYMLIEGDPLTCHANINYMEKNLQKSNPIKHTTDMKESYIKKETYIKKESNGSPFKDTLFWCFFTILKGDQEYELNHSFKREKEFKIESIEKMRTIKSELKAFKLRLNEIENELLNEKKITIKSLVALCLLYKINIMYVWNRKYFEITNNADEKMNIIINEKNEDKIADNISSTMINYYRENFWCIENISKPLKAITAYTKDELIIIVQKLEIKDISTKKTKKEMYEKIIQNIC